MAPAHETRAKLAVFLPPLCFVGFISVTFVASRARRGYFGSPLKTGGEVHVHSTKAADGLLVARSSVGNSEGRPETASIESFQSVMLAVSDLEAGPSLTLPFTPRLGDYGTNRSLSTRRRRRACARSLA